ncbi:VOC family protein [Aeromicrobium sp. 179-A 4D2 NHS]|uniref:VOC family protein n=1 Tax=Aeromicrobium sp. 179-A 4D2 NHS TaxID=3142375 RepID=UPI00399F90FD
MTAVIRQWTIDARDIDLMARFWAEALGYRLERDGDGPTCHLWPPDDAPEGAVTVWVQHAGEPKTTKNRAHVDLRPADGDVDREVERLLSLGATYADVGQGPDEAFVVLRDPEGNEFCVLKVPR